MRPNQQPVLDFASSDARAGFRLHRLEVYNWGTFDQRVWTFAPLGESALLTGDIGSGKSTLVDALTTLLVAPQKLAYNRAAGAEARERTLRSYVLGHYKSERGDAGSTAKAVALRDHNGYSVVLARFVNEGYAQTVTLAQVFWIKDTEGQPARLLIVADRALSIASDFADFGTDIADLRKRLRRTTGVELFDSFPSYSAAFRRRFGIENEQALDLFHQTVSMKSVGNLTDFVRQHMLEPFPVEERIDALIRHFDDLSRAHETVLRAKAQVEALAPIVSDCGRHTETAGRIEGLRTCREALRPYFSMKKAELLDRRIELLDADTKRSTARLERATEQRRDHGLERDRLKRAIAQNGGDRLQQLADDIARKSDEVAHRRRRAERYAELALTCELPMVDDVSAFVANQAAVAAALDALAAQQSQAQNDITEASVALRQLRAQHEALQGELESLRRRKSNLPASTLRVRERLCADLGIDETELPFAGELIEVREDERDWEGAAERLLHGFALAMLVPDGARAGLYAQVSQWVDRTHLGERLVYFRARDPRPSDGRDLGPRSLVHKLAVRPDSGLYAWLTAELARRFDYACCDSLDDFRREPQAVTSAGQLKGRDDRHEKDDRRKIDDRSHYVLGWSNLAKIAALETNARALEAQIQSVGERVSTAQRVLSGLQVRAGRLQQLAAFESYRDLEWKPLTVDIAALEAERRALEAASDVLRTLETSLRAVEVALVAAEEALITEQTELRTLAYKRGQAAELLTESRRELDKASEATRADVFPRLDVLRAEVLGDAALTVEACDNRERDLRVKLQERLDNESRALDRLTTKIVGAMQTYRHTWPLETQDVDASVLAAGDYARMLEQLRSDDLPRFEARFKELLNENTIREVAGFQSQLRRERQGILERVARINDSLRAIDYNPGRFIMLESVASTDPEVRDFQHDLRTCTEGSLTGSEDEAYSEAKFLEVKRIIERFRGREGTTELDRRWTRKVTDVRSWFTFSASERWKEDGREHEHYSDSGGKSGGQKEKLAYTVLAASLAYQLGLEVGAVRSRSFRFVVIDEAFGRGSDESARFGLELFGRLGLQLLVVTPMQKLHIIEPFVRSVGFVHNEDGRKSFLRCLTIDEYRAERDGRAERAARAG